MSCRGRCGLPLFIALLVFAAAAWGQGNEPMVVDLSLPANLEPDFTLWLTGKREGDRFAVSFDGKPLISARDKKRFQTAAKSHCGPRPTA
jgi:hypothetical protein